MTRIAVTGSIATDYLMTFPAKFADQLIAEEIDNLSLSFLVDELTIHRGGAGANIAYGIGSLGLTPTLIGAVGNDYDDSWLVQHGVDTTSMLISTDHHTARFMCATDIVQNQIATFYAGAMQQARTIDLARITDRTEPFDLVVVSPNDPAAMIAHSNQCRLSRTHFAADPSQQLARLNREEVRSLVVGATYLFTNEYENALLRERTGWNRAQVLVHVGAWVTTLGAGGVRIEQTDHNPTEIPAVSTNYVADPTGAGDGFRAGFLVGRSTGLDFQAAAQLGCTVATFVLESEGAQEYELTLTAIADRVRAAYGDAAAYAINAVLTDDGLVSALLDPSLVKQL